ncbi:MAG: iron ABC transporter substrate-binding protein [Acidimicrobiia bacterium]|nr:iron ABC transporter substrate-binding protein [Acidimicrobiia bacterium]
MNSARRGVLVMALGLLAALVAGFGAAGCTGSSGDTLTVYSGRTENLIGPLLDDFAQETGIDIDVRYGQSADLALLIESEGDRSPADVFISQSPGALGFLEADGRLSELSPETLDLVDEQFRDPDGEWVGLSARVRVLVYNTDAVNEDELPESVFDLVNEEYAGRVGVAPENGSFQDFVSGMRETVGDDETSAWLEGMADNGTQTYANNTAILEAVARGEVDMGLVNHYYNERAKAENPDTPTENYFFPGGDLGTLVLVTGAGIVDTAPHPDDAEELLAFLLNEESQQFFAAETFEYPLAAGVEPTVDLPPLAGIDTPPVTLGALGGDLAVTRDMISDSGLGAG